MGGYLHKALILVWLCFLARGVFYSALLPLWEGCDEWAHFAYVQHVANTGRVSTPGITRPSREVIESLPLAPVPWTQRNEHPAFRPYDTWWSLPPAERARLEQRLLNLPREWRAEHAVSSPNYESQQPPLYYYLAALPLRLLDPFSLPTRVFLLRCLGVALASLAIPLGFLLARDILSSGTAALGVVALVTAMPEGMINYARVSNEPPAAPIYTAMMLIALRLARGDAGPVIAIPLGLLLGAGLLTKAYMLTAIPAVCFLTAWSVWRNPRARRSVLITGAAACLIGVAIGGWWYAFMLQTTGTITGMIQTVAVRHVGLAERLGAVLRIDWLRAFDTLAISHLWFGAWSFLQVRSWMYRVFEWMLLPAAAGLLALLIRRRELAGMLVPSAFVGAFLCSLAYHVVVGYIEYKLSMTSGWYLYSVIFGLVCLLALGWHAAAPAAARPWILPSIAACFVLLDLYTVHFILLPYYQGLITHSPEGRLLSFQLANARATLAEVAVRVPVNRPFLPGAAGLAVLWAVGMAATVAPVAAAFFAAARERGTLTSYAAEPR